VILFQATIPGRVAIKKNSKQIIPGRGGRRPTLISSPKYLAWERMAVTWLLKALLDQTSLEKERQITCPVEVHMVFYFKSHLHEPDIDNCLGGPLDVLQKSGILQNDRQVQRVTAEKRFGHGEGIQIQIFKVNQSEGEKCG